MVLSMTPNPSPNPNPNHWYPLTSPRVERFGSLLVAIDPTTGHVSSTGPRAMSGAVTSAMPAATVICPAATV